MAGGWGLGFIVLVFGGRLGAVGSKARGAVRVRVSCGDGWFQARSPWVGLFRVVWYARGGAVVVYGGVLGGRWFCVVGGLRVVGGGVGSGGGGEGGWAFGWLGKNVVPLRSDTIWLVQNGCSFHRLRFEDPNQHLKDFLKLVDSLDLDDENKERMRLRLFQFSLRDEASNWLERLPAGSITTCTDKAKITRKQVKTGQTRTQERKSTQKAGRKLSKSKSQSFSQLGQPKSRYSQRKHKGVTSRIATLAIRVRQSNPTVCEMDPMIEEMIKGQD
ncbi:hypothetical protein Tco_0642534 [Tanacetum coccineum]